MLWRLALVAVLAGPVLADEVISSWNGRFQAVVTGDSTVALYELVPRSRRLIAEIAVHRARFRELLVSDSGRYVVAVDHGVRGCFRRLGPDDAVITIYDAGAATSRSLTAAGLLGWYDLWMVNNPGGAIDYALRHESDTREVLVATIGPAERRIDLATAALLDPKDDVFPKPRVRVTPVDVPLREYLPADCAASFDDQEVVRVSSHDLYARAVDAPLPEFPALMIKARIRGVVIVDVLVGEDGRVLCARPSGLPFGGSDAAAGAARQWRFTPMTVDGQRVRFAGELLFHFSDERSGLR